VRRSEEDSSPSGTKTEKTSSHFEADPDGRAGIRILGISKNFGGKWAVKDMQLNVYENQITALLGKTKISQ